jgi:hypothetical protein
MSATGPNTSAGSRSYAAGSSWVSNSTSPRSCSTRKLVTGTVTGPWPPTISMEASRVMTGASSAHILLTVFIAYRVLAARSA